MEKHGFSKSYIQFLEILYKDYISPIINNGFLFETAMMLRETTTENIRLTIPNSKKQLKISRCWLKLIPINTEITTNLANEITTKEQNETIKILGIYFNEDLQHANELN